MDSNHVFRMCCMCHKKCVVGSLEEMCRHELQVSHFYVSYIVSQSATHATHFILVCVDYFNTDKKDSMHVCLYKNKLEKDLI